MKIPLQINNAGVGKFGGLMQSTADDFDRCMETNVKSVLNLTKLATPHLIKTKGTHYSSRRISVQLIFIGNLTTPPLFPLMISQDDNVLYIFIMRLLNYYKAIKTWLMWSTTLYSGGKMPRSESWISITKANGHACFLSEHPSNNLINHARRNPVNFHCALSNLSADVTRLY